MSPCTPHFQRFFSLSLSKPTNNNKTPLQEERGVLHKTPGTKWALESNSPSFTASHVRASPLKASSFSVFFITFYPWVHGPARTPLGVLPVCEDAAGSPSTYDRWEPWAQRREIAAPRSHSWLVLGLSKDLMTNSSWVKCSFCLLSIIFGNRIVIMKWETALPLASGSFHSVSLKTVILLVQLQCCHLQKWLPGDLRPQHFLPLEPKMCISCPTTLALRLITSSRLWHFHVTKEPTYTHHRCLSMTPALGEPQQTVVCWLLLIAHGSSYYDHETSYPKI